MESHRQLGCAQIIRVLTGFLTAASLIAALPAAAQIITPPFDADYTLVDLGSVPGLPPRYGGLTFQAGDPNTLLIGGEANIQSGRLYAISVLRGADNHITGFSGTATVFADAAFNDGGVSYGPGNVLFLSRWPVNQLGQTRPGSMITDKIIDLTPFDVASSHAALNFVPAGFPGAGQLKLVSFSGGQWYTATFSPDGLGTFNIDSVTLETVIGGGPEGFIYVPPGSPQFQDFNSMLVSEFSAGAVAAYQLDANGDPIPTTRASFITGLSGAEGAAIDPLTGDFLFSTFGGGNRVIVVRGFAAPVIGEIAMVLGTPLGDGNLSVAVDGYGSFGSSVGPEISDAIYDPVGPIEPAGTTFQSGVAIRLGAVGGRTFLTTGDIGGSGSLANPGFTAVTPDGCQATPPCASAMSVFSFGGLDIILTQAVEELISEGVRMGSRLTQTYTISNFGTVPAAFELIRYFDGDLRFDGSIVDGGGRIVVGQQEILFETDMAGEPAASTTFVGITGNGGSAEPPDRFEVDFFPVLQAKISGGGTLDDIVTNDGPDADEFIDPGLGYDVTLALRNSFVLNPGESTMYTTQTLFGSGAPEEFVDLSLTKTDSPDPVEVGQNLTYIVTVTNNGPDAVMGAVLTDMLPTGVTLVSTTPSQGNCTAEGGVVTCDLGALANGASATVTVGIIPTVPGAITNTASVTSDVSDPDSTNNRATASTTVGAALLQFSDGINSLTVNTATGEFALMYSVDGATFACSGVRARVDEGLLTVSDRCREDSRDSLRAVGPIDSSIAVELIDYTGAAASDRVIRPYSLMRQ